MITGELKNKIDKLWLEFWQGGIANPLTVIEQITFLMFAKLLDINESRDEKRADRTSRGFTRRFKDNEQHLRWSQFSHIEDAERLIKVVRDEVFLHFRTHTGDSRFGDYMKDARLAIDKPSLLVKAIEMIDALPLEAGDTKGDLYEYLLSKLTTAGINGQFRTPRHIIKLMVRLLDPQPDEIIADPACGTAGFLVAVMEHLLETYSSEQGVLVESITDDKGKAVVQKTYTGDLLDQTQWRHIKTQMFHGFDFDSTMLRIAAMNLYMHGVEDPDIHYQDSLAQSFADKFPALEQNAFNVILANPPFKGSLDEDTINPPILRLVKTKKTELLFIAQILRMLKIGGRSATVVPQGVLFGSSKAHQTVRQLLIENNQLEAVINLPSGVFKPYAGVATAILIFVKGGATDHVWFYDVQDDGFSLDDKRDPLYQDEQGNPLGFAGDLPKVLEAYQKRDKAIADTAANDKTQACFWISKAEIVANKYDLSVNRYKETVHQEEEYEDPKEILQQWMSLVDEIQDELKELEGML
ncbi:type I restriction-modification system subunit M [Methylotuvimicrobium buryatense]|uniref:site-specific DNA-methyltransferase (adenine-specific) n=1 Tax=Methylotuvimicrobium buryatense TaxID=95641 RepID=A0A4P9UM02_METBY|nr:class I SAM-dependent DNA methyltransferase [Methylotuvimicrobium buryatense]QCW81181.1 SAM-dependent DNA methyltransferase [Methylotuvimicrobium buryatense]